jgi:flagellar operon protein
VATDPIGANPALTPPGVSGPGPARPAAGSAPAGPAFGHVLRAELDRSAPLQWSGHALERLRRRGIPVDAQTMARLSEAVGKAGAKGARDALVLIDATAFVVSVKNRTVITAVGAEHMKERVFTNIDSAVIN